MNSFLKIFLHFLIFFYFYSLVQPDPDFPNPFSVNCTSKIDCGPNFTCNYDTQKCICDYGFIPDNLTGICQPMTCSSNDNCTAQFGAFSQCSSAGTCDCFPDFDVDPETQQCNLRLGVDCKSKEQCGLHAGCYEGFCRCDYNYYANADLFNCEAFPCLDSRHCQVHFGKNSVCRPSRIESDAPSICGCTNPLDYYLSRSSQRCLKRLNHTRPCTASADCADTHSRCVDGACACQVGFILSHTNWKCRPYYCLNNEECAFAFPQSECTQKLNCACNANGFELSKDGMKCVAKQGAWIKYCLATGVVAIVVVPIGWFIVKNFLLE